MKILNFFFAVLLIHTSAFCFQLIEKISTAQTGDYALLKQDKNLSFLCIKQKTFTHLVFEEICLPENFPYQTNDWQQWYASEAPGCTSWFRFTMNLEDGVIESLYNTLENKEVQIGSSNTVLKYLFFLKFDRIPHYQRKRLGSRSNTPFDKTIWHPPITVKNVAEKLPSSSWRTTWPKDHSSLSGKTIEMYLIDSESTQYPTYFPVWIEVSGNMTMIKLRALEVGRIQL